MQFRGFGNALTVALISILLMLGALSISLVEHMPEMTMTPTSILLPSAAPITLEPLLPATIATTPQPFDTPTETITSTPTITATAPSHCPIPAGWGQAVVQPYDTLESIAARYNISAAQLRDWNCLPSNKLIAGSVLYVPPVPTNTVVACRVGRIGWRFEYPVKWGDTFYSIAGRYGTTAAVMKEVNCRSSDSIYPGETLWVPIVSATLTPLPTQTPVPGDTALPYPTDPLTETPLPFTATIVPSPTLVPNTPTAIPTLTASPTAFPE